MNQAGSWSDLVDIAFEPLRPFLSSAGVVEICVNEPGSVYVETRDGGRGETMSRHVVSSLTRERIRFMAERVAAASHQFVNEEEPLLSAALADGARVQVALPPAAADGGAIVIRRQVVRNLSLRDYGETGALSQTRIVTRDGALTDDETQMCRLLAQGDIETFLRAAVRRRISVLVSGGTGSGKTTFLNALMQEIPPEERIITIEDTPELAPCQPNHVRLIATRGSQNIARVDARRLVEASLRMRPDRLLLGEVRGSEAFDFLQAINTGHPGSLSTVHANSPRGAYERLAMLVMQHAASGSLTRPDIIEALRVTLPLVVQVTRAGGRPGQVSDVYYEPFLRTGRSNAATSGAEAEKRQEEPDLEEFVLRARRRSWA